jgi:O-methyltransferase involved in polyketide biosynthesis
MTTPGAERTRTENIDIVDEGHHPEDTVAGRVVTVEIQCDERRETEPREGIVPDIAGVSETMLWSLYNRATEARRADGILVDPGSVTIQSAIDYNFARHFGDPGGLLAARAAAIDHTLRSWIAHHPDGIVVSLGEGLETQVRRVDNDRMRWLSVDLPDAIRLRERFLTPTDRFRHVAVSALDPIWMDAVDPAAGIFIVAQGLLMYFDPEKVRQLLVTIADRFPGSELVFDAIPRWFSDLTRTGLQQTASYRLPAMPWGINRDEVEPTLRTWHPQVVAVRFLDYRSPRGLPDLFAGITNRIPVARHAVPSLVHVTIANADPSTMPTIIPDTAGAEFGCENAKLPVTSSGKPNMISVQDEDSTVYRIGDFLAAAVQNARCGDDIAIAATHVIAKRVALAVAATLNLPGVDRAEFSRMVREKVEAFSTAGMVMLKQSGQANRQIMGFASDEVITTARATIEMTRCRNPAALAEAQGRFARAWFSRATWSWIAMGTRAFEAQAAAMAPIRQTVVANAERLALPEATNALPTDTGALSYVA